MPPGSDRPPHRFSGVGLPAALLAVLLLIIPGAILVLVSLLGGEGRLNGWLQRNLGLSYHIPLPTWAALLLLLVPLLIVLLYFLKMRRRPLQVPSTFLWRKSVEDLQVNSFFQWLRNNVLLLLQLLTILFLIYAVMAFQIHGAADPGRHYILILDSSASMSATDVPDGRLEAAREQALAVIDTHSDRDVGMVIEFSSRAWIRQPYTTDRALLRAAVRRIRPSQRATRIDEALALADSLANPRQTTDDQAVRPADETPGKERTYVPSEGLAAEVHLFSDGGFPDGDDFAAGSLDIHYHRVGRPGAEAVDNVAIVDFNASRDEQRPGTLDVFARVLSFRPAPAAVKVELEYRVEGQAAFQLREVGLTLPARTVAPPDPERGDPGRDAPGEGIARFEIPDIDDRTTILLARLRGAGDSLPLDDQAWIVAGVVRKARVLIVTPGNAILRHFFDQEEAGRVATVSYLAPADLGDEARYAGPARNGAFDLVVFDRCAPEKAEQMPLANTFFIDSVPPPWRREQMPPLENVLVRNPTSGHPLMRHLSGLDEIAFSRAFRFELDPGKDPRVPPRVPRLLETDRDTAVLFALESRAFTDLVLAFPLVDDQGQWLSTWPLKLSFPLFLRNVLYRLGNVSDAAGEENVRPGEVKRLRPDAPVRRVEVYPPGRDVPEVVERAGGGDFLFQDTEEVGVYRARWEGGGRGFAVSLLDAEESGIQPRDHVQIGAQRVAADRAVGQPRQLWKWAALAALLLLLVEWAFYHRRIFH